MGRLIRVSEIVSNLPCDCVFGYIPKLGDWINRNDPVAEITSKYGTIRLQSPVTGQVESVHVITGNSVTAETSIVTLGCKNLIAENNYKRPSSPIVERYAALRKVEEMLVDAESKARELAQRRSVLACEFEEAISNELSLGSHLSHILLSAFASVRQSQTLENARDESNDPNFKVRGWM